MFHLPGADVMKATPGKVYTKTPQGASAQITKITYKCALALGNYAITFDQVQYYLKGVPGANDRYKIAVLAHEFIHSMQYDKLGALKFKRLYARELIFGTLMGATPMEAYRSIGFEISARAFELTILQNSKLWADFLAGTMTKLSDAQKAKFKEQYSIYCAELSTGKRK
jgi:hypothetical protein